MSDFLIHFTKGDTLESSYNNLVSIITEQAVHGSNTKIRDGSNCVCFSEAPLSSLQNGLLNPSFYSPYSPFGIITNKEHIFTLGGRPVIYQPENEFTNLIDANSWRHMRHEPPKIDFTWEREWRLKTDDYLFEPNNTQIIVPDSTWTDRLIEEHNIEENWRVLQYGLIIDELLALLSERTYPWVIVELNNT